MKTTGLLLLGLLLDFTAKAEFPASYAFSPPASGVYYVDAPTFGNSFGNWLTYVGQGEVTVDTRCMPESLTLQVGEVPANNWNGTFTTTASTSGTVFFVYQADIINQGTFSWTYHDTNNNTVVSNVTASTTTPTFVSFPVIAGSSFGFGVSANAGATLNVTISGFNVVTNSTAPFLGTELVTPDTILIWWPSSLSQWTLQENTNIATTNWSAVSAVPNDGGVIRSLLIPTGSNAFFRLAQ